MYVKANNGVVDKFPFSIGDLRKENPNTSFPRVMSAETLAQYNVFPVTEQDRPETDRFAYAVKRHLPTLVNGVWVVSWDVIQKSQEALAEENEQQATTVRDARNMRLTATDWTQVADAPVNKAAWMIYRQALRDITSQAGFP